MPLVLLHGALGAASQLDPLREEFGAQAIELPGHGSTPLGDNEFSIPSFSKYVRGKIDADGPVDIFGYSMGGYVALHLARCHPEKVRRIVTLGTKFEWSPEIAKKESSRLDPQVIEAKVHAFAEQLSRRHTAEGWEVNLQRTADLLRELGDRPVLTADTLPQIHQPICIAVGDRDNTVTVEECERADALLPIAIVRVLADTPHPIEQVDQGRLTALLREFFA